MARISLATAPIPEDEERVQLITDDISSEELEEQNETQKLQSEEGTRQTPLEEYNIDDDGPPQPPPQGKNARTLASRLGCRPRGLITDKKYARGVFPDPLTLLPANALGSLDGHLAELDKKFKELGKKNQEPIGVVAAIQMLMDLEKNATISPMVVEVALNAALQCQQGEHLREAVAKLVHMGLVSDWAFPGLLKILTTWNDVSLLLDFVQHVEDISEASLALLVSFFLESEEQTVGLADLTTKEIRLLTVMSRVADAAKLEPCLRQLRSEQAVELLQLLIKLWQHYTLTYANQFESIAPYSLPSRENLLIWMEALLGAHASTFQQQTELLGQVYALVVDTCRLEEELLLAKAPISSTIFFARSAHMRKERLPTRPKYNDYTLEIVTL